MSNYILNNEEIKSQSIYIEMLSNLEQIIFGLTKENFDFSIDQTKKLFDLNYPYSFNLIISELIYSAFYSRKDINDLYLNYLKTIQIKEEEINQNTPKIVKIFCNYISNINTQESYYLICKMIERNLIDSNITKNIYTNYFAHYKTESKNIVKYGDPFEKNFRKNYEELSKDNWELHKQYIKEGVNRKEIAQIIRNDEIEKLQEISSQTNFDFNQTIEPSLYERYSFINEENVTLIDYAAFFSSVKCFKYLLLNGANVKNTGQYAVSGGNEEIIHLCEQNHSSFENTLETAIMFHKNNIFKYIYENKLKKSKINIHLALVHIRMIFMMIIKNLKTLSSKIWE